MRLIIRSVVIALVVLLGSFSLSLAVMNYFDYPPSSRGKQSSSGPDAVAAAAPDSPPEAALNWNEALYLALYPDVAAAVAQKKFKSGLEHYELAGRFERRQSGYVPNSWNEQLYLQVNQDVGAAVKAGAFLSGYHQYLAAGRAQHRQGGFVPGYWDEAEYLRVNPDVAAAVKAGSFLSGYHHYLTAGRAEKRQGGFLPGWRIEK
jgi:hypothetical protein